jgi:hypothetical protein
MPCGGLGYESKCWVGFDFQFDKMFLRVIWSLHKCQRVKVWERGLEEEMFLTLLDLWNRQSLRLDYEMWDLWNRQSLRLDYENVRW